MFLGRILRVVVPDRPTPWALAIVGISLLLLLVTFVSYPLVGRGSLSLLLFTLGLGGEGNVGAWWSGMLFLLAAVFALDRAAAAQPSTTEGPGWLALAAALALLSFDEVAWLHEFLTGRNRLYLVPLGAVGLGLVAYALVQLRRAKVRLGTLLLGFALLATVPPQEFVQITQAWRNPWVYGARAFVEEGTEIVAALVLLSATSGGLLRLRVSGAGTFASLSKLGTPLLWLAVVALPLAVAAMSRLNLPGVTNWMGSSMFLLCALLAFRAAQQPCDGAALAKAGLFLLASVGTNAVRPDWDPVVLGHAVNLRGIYFGLLFFAAAWILAPGGALRQRAFWLALAGTTWLAAILGLRPHLIWSTWPPTIALLCVYIEIAAAMRIDRALARDDAIERVAGVKAPELAGPF
jgi:hypothetical protein